MRVSLGIPNFDWSLGFFGWFFLVWIAASIVAVIGWALVMRRAKRNEPLQRDWLARRAARAAAHRAPPSNGSPPPAPPPHDADLDLSEHPPYQPDESRNGPPFRS